MHIGNHTDEFLAFLGHEMKNSLSVLRHSLDIWSMRDPSLMDDLRHSMERQVRQLTRLSDDLLDTARIARGELELQNKCVSLGEVVEDACEEIRPLIANRGHTLSVDLPDAPITVFGDSIRLIQVFANLLQNAAKFTKQNGSLRVSIEPLSEKVAVRVSDNGCGIESVALKTIFKSGSLVNEEQKLVNDGLGIGLKLVKAIVDSHGGSVAAESGGIGHGCEFTVFLPLWNEADHVDNESFPRTDPPQSLRVNQQTAFRIVIVDDDRELGELLAQLLRRIGQSVTVSTNGLEAIELILRKRPQVVFLDLMLGDPDGYSVACELRKHNELDGMTLVALSGFGDEQHKRRAQDAGCDMFLVKPVGLLDFTNVLDQVSSSGRSLV